MDAENRCDAGDAAGCDYIHTNQMPVLPGSHTGSDGGGFVQMFPTDANGDIVCPLTAQSIACKEERARIETAKNKNGINPADFDTVDTSPDPAPAGLAPNDGGVANDAVPADFAQFAADNGLDPADFADFFADSGDAQGGF
jgi:hypothetical protein